MDVDSYLKFVQKVASKQNKVFYLNHGEGKDFCDPVTGWYVEDFSGWLIDPDKTGAFEKYLEEGQEGNTFENCYVFAIWTRDGEGKIGVEFTYWNYLNYIDADDKA